MFLLQPAVHRHVCSLRHSEPGRRRRAPLRRNQLGLGASQKQDEGSGAEGGRPSLWYGRRPVHVHGLRPDTDTNKQLTQHLLDEITLKTVSRYPERISHYQSYSLKCLTGLFSSVVYSSGTRSDPEQQNSY